MLFIIVFKTSGAFLIKNENPDFHIKKGYFVAVQNRFKSVETKLKDSKYQI